MRTQLYLFALVGMTTASAVNRRADPPTSPPSGGPGGAPGGFGGPPQLDPKTDAATWKPKTKDPHFFNLKVDEVLAKCTSPPVTDPTNPDFCFDGYAIRLEKGIAIATPYNKWWDPKLPTFFVDDDTQGYTVSRDPLQLYIDAVTGALKYTKVGWLPPSAISTAFFHTGNNPLGILDPSPAQFTWPSTAGITPGGDGVWLLCNLGSTGQFQVFCNDENFNPQGVTKADCIPQPLAAINANPWKS